ncbi:MAG: ATP-binding protein, partial [Gammaproteobacteria bacterium]|nr:ATP-binding protein [Gammaproteobacteria bacterium]
SATLRNFTEAEVAQLYAQHTETSGQIFPPEAVHEVWRHTQGQPWLVNAIGDEITERIAGADNAILPEHIEQAVQNIIKRRDTHIDSLMERLKEVRVQRIVEPMVLGENIRCDLLDDDYQYVLDLGLLREADRRLEPACPIYGEVLLRTLSSLSQRELEDMRHLPETPAYLTGDKLDMRRLLADFQAFWRVNSESWTERYTYKEAAPHLILHAFLYRIVNGGGQITREMASGNGRLDLCLHYRGGKYPVELKIRYGENTCPEGRDQLAGYMDKLGCTEGWLAVFDRRVTVAWDDKIFWKTHETDGKRIHTAGC